MRTAEEFNVFYTNPDPWHISQARFRDKVLWRRLSRFVRRKSVLELGCGEGHLTRTVFNKAKSVVGVDISDVAIGRAKALGLSKARFQCGDFLQVSFEGYDVIAAIECIYYLSHEDQGAFLEKVRNQHAGKILLLSGPIIDYPRYFSHGLLVHEFKHFGFSLIKFNNLSVYWHPAANRIVAKLVKLPLGYTLLDKLPERMVYQRLYALRAPKKS
jgi:SAM-dependent methyltransferase